MPVGSIHKAGELELANILILKNINKLQNANANCVGMHYKPNQVAYVGASSRKSP